jgi:selenocysteine-specific elongation factor
VAGGEIISIAPLLWKKQKKKIAEKLNEYISSSKGLDPSSREGMKLDIEFYLAKENKKGSDLERISKHVLLDAKESKNLLSELCDEKKVLFLGGDFYVHSESYSSFLSAAETRVKKAIDGKNQSLTLSELRQDLDWPEKVWKRIEKDLELKGLFQRQGNRFVLKAPEEELNQNDRLLLAEIQKIYKKTGFHSPRPDELPCLMTATQEKIEWLLEYLCNRKILIRLARNVLLDYDSFRLAQDMVVKIIREKGVLNSADFKHHIGSSRKYALAVLDFLDKQRVTMRFGNDRKLSPDYQRNLL